ncbi:MAG: WG repeat-containing protein [Lachnospiraceae bacterium]|nr:WG repeat-containing protein [Lachnospiraceae bacterium]
MKKKTIILLTILATVLLIGCGHEHEWEEATCDKPKTCKTCGETEGEALGHDIIEATCEEPMTCRRCGKKKGQALGHDWEEATCEAPKTCKRCGKTEGEPLEHDFAPATLDEPKTCRYCGLTEGEPVSLEIKRADFLKGAGWSWVINENLCVAEYENPKNYWTYNFFDLDGHLLHEQELDCRVSKSTYKGHKITVADDCYLMAWGDTKNSTICIYDYDFHLILQKEVKSGKLFSGQFPDIEDGNADGCKMVFNDTTREAIFCFNVNTGREISEDEYWNAVDANMEMTPDYPADKYICYNREDAVDGYFVGTADESAWGYVDENGNEIAMYKDATAYSASGYALVTKDGHSYDLIDCEQNVVGAGVVTGKSAFLAGDGGNLFKVLADDSSTLYVIVR